MKILGFICAILMLAFIFLLTIPLWSDNEIICEYWEKKNNEMICIKETIYFCLKTNCDK